MESLQQSRNLWWNRYDHSKYHRTAESQGCCNTCKYHQTFYSMTLTPILHLMHHGRTFRQVALQTTSILSSIEVSTIHDPALSPWHSTLRERHSVCLTPSFPFVSHSQRLAFMLLFWYTVIIPNNRANGHSFPHRTQLQAVPQTVMQRLGSKKCNCQNPS